MMTGLPDADSIKNALRAGADGYLIKPVTPDQCRVALKFAVVPRSSPKGSRRETEPSTFPTASLRPGSKLTPRENELMEYFAQSLLYKEAADRMGISYALVHKLQHKIFVKLHVSNKTEAISKWI